MTEKKVNPIAAFFGGIASWCKGFFSAFAEGDIFTKLTFIWWGAGSVKRKQFLKAIIFTLLEVLVIWFSISIAFEYVPKFASLGTVEAEKVFKGVCPDRSIASWALRYAASRKGVITALSGMSSIDQVKDNISSLKDFKSLSAEEIDAIDKVREIIGASKAVPCTACRYCTEGCPMGIRIPDIFTALNIFLQNEDALDEAKAEYDKAAADGAKASDCIECGQCEGACPQRIGIIDKLKLAAEKLEA